MLYGVVWYFYTWFLSCKVPDLVSFLAECAKRLAEQWYQWEEEEKECHIYSTSCLCAWMLYIMLS